MTHLQYRLATDHARPQTELRARQEDPTTVMARWKINGIITSLRYITLKTSQNIKEWFEDNLYTFCNIFDTKASTNVFLGMTSI